MRDLFRLSGAVDCSDPVNRWLRECKGDLGATAREWFAVLRQSGDGVQEVMHDGCATACLGDAAFAYVGVYTDHVTVGFFHGAALPDPGGLLQGRGKYMRHVKLIPGRAVDSAALEALIGAAYRDISARLNAGH